MAGRRSLRLAALVLALSSYVACRPPQPTRVTLRFHPFVGDEALALDQARYSNPGGRGRFEVRAFQFFVSNIRLKGDRVEFAEPESYHLARFDGDDRTFAVVIDKVPRDRYRRIELGLGVDAAANGSRTPMGELDPNGRMAWSWDVGYKFVLLEGALELGDGRVPLVYHIGFSENYQPLSFDLSSSLLDETDATLHFRVDLLKMFQGVQTIDMAALPTVKFDHADARMLAENYAGMVSICPSDCTH
jgi:hypothetical protein